MCSFVYKYILNDEIVYIGKCDADLNRRIYQHTKDHLQEISDKCDIFFCKLANRTMSDVVESELIRRYKPKYNTAKMSEWAGIDFVEPKWEKYEGITKSVAKETIDELPEDSDLYWVGAHIKMCPSECGEWYVSRKPMTEKESDDFFAKGTFILDAEKEFGHRIGYNAVYELIMSKSKSEIKEHCRKENERIKEIETAKNKEYKRGFSACEEMTKERATWQEKD